MQFELNEKKVTVDVDGDVPLLWIIREELRLLGTKFGCGMAQCGACTVLLDGSAVRSCLLPIAAVEGKKITTIEGLEADPIGKKLVEKWIESNVSQCGYCQPGQLMSACSLLKANKAPNIKDVVDAMQGNICRCGTYPRIQEAILDVAQNQGN